MKAYLLYGSEDEGFRFPLLDNGFGSLDSAITAAEKYLTKQNYANRNEDGRPTIFAPTKKQVENSGAPNCHGKVTRMYCLDGNKYKSKLKTDDGYAYDWLYIVEVNIK